jgi:cytochrome c oxidase assembly factor CtaG/cytochrome c2
MRVLIVTALLWLLPATAFAHGRRHETLTWNWDWWVLLSLGICIWLYTTGVLHMRRRQGAARLIDNGKLACFFAGLFTLFVALESPIDTVAEQLFSAHMVQHMLLLFVAPPLLVWGRPPIAFMWAFRSPARRSLGWIWGRLGFKRLFALAMSPGVVWLLFSGSFIFWHFPKPYQWALANEGVHALEHLCFFVTGLMFWTIVIEPSGRRRLTYPATLIHVSTTAILGGLPGALIFLAKFPLYPQQTADAAAWGLTPLQDQQLAGVIMWVPAGLLYVVAIAWLFAKWLQDAEQVELKRVARLSAGLSAIVLLPLVLGACNGEAGAQPSSFGDAGRGAALISYYGCGSCHSIPGVSGATALVGPPLDHMGKRIYIAGMLRNTPENMAYWIMHPQKVVPGNAMPDMGIGAKQARDITAYLYALR